MQILNECFLLTGIEADRALLAVLLEFGDIIVDAVKGKRAALPTLALAQAHIDAAEGVAKSCKFQQYLGVSRSGAIGAACM